MSAHIDSIAAKPTPLEIVISLLDFSMTVLAVILTLVTVIVASSASAGYASKRRQPAPSVGGGQNSRCRAAAWQRPLATLNRPGGFEIRLSKRSRGSSADQHRILARPEHKQHMIKHVGKPKANPLVGNHHETCRRNT